MSSILFKGDLTLLLFLFQVMCVGCLWSRTFHININKCTYIIYIYTYIYIYIFIFMAQQPLVGQGQLFVHSWRSHSLDTPHSVGLLWTSAQLDAETWTWRHSTLTRDRPPCPRGDSNPQSQRASGSCNVSFLYGGGDNLKGLCDAAFLSPHLSPSKSDVCSYAY